MHKIILLINALCIFVIACCLVYQIFLPYSYVFVVIILSGLLAFSIVKDGFNSKIVIFQLLLVFFLIRNIFYLSTQNVIPFGDGYWDFAVEKTFLDQGQVSTIQGIVRPTEAGGISQLTWYSGWPFLHTFGISFSLITGLDPIYLNWGLSNFLALISFVFTYLIFEKFRIKLKLPVEVTVIALLFYAMAPEAIFWQMQFVRQSFALALLAPIIYLLYILSCEKFDLKYCFVLGLLILSLVVTHHVTAFTLTLFLLLFAFFNSISKKVGLLNRLSWIYSSVGSKIFLGFGGLTLISMLLWWFRNSDTIIPTLASRIVLFFETLGMEKTYSGLTATYPSVLVPSWVPLLLGFRDVIIYGLAIFGFLILLRNKSKVPEKFFIIYSVVGFGVILIINVVFRIEPIRIILFMAPFLTFLSSVLISRVRQISRVGIKLIVGIGLMLVIFSSFLGLWGHSFAPIHLYDPSINPAEIGESTPDFIRIKAFFEDKINVSSYKDVRADVIGRLVYLLDPEDFDKIKSLPFENLDKIDLESTLICSFNDLNLYLYYGYVWSPIDISEAKVLQQELREYLDANFNRIYGDESISIWIS